MALRCQMKRTASALARTAPVPVTATRTVATNTKPRKIDHHALIVLTSIGSYFQVTQGVMRHQSKNWLRTLVDKEPVVAFSFLVAGVAIALPVTVVPLRHAMGCDTSQYYGAGVSLQSE
mmetsp:Transcript_20031/g.36220  ORF Transcript_20031/g.36220 Transcript_20031/m.36220 type:complete len:119 (+) Transcript_20031:127-483(+)|eukprot:CAMPEP_0205921244 /NCGR_PEP_ID=MMETSP1325-20131115/12523_1 /ASSEMBLY_ACC=CAM_ASM_000708 /TAXON_ID=236786 /ORGANISM="Florenciella sp., Strain RCC1007" /LENGTH=118 /DNA_ID=CAMNT_0053289027 /DNA_START=127 /DNA_END=483 /DNA_ORIENTATION=-